jgi:putative oxidoreductase
MTTTGIADRPVRLSLDSLQRPVARLLAAHSVTALRISLALIIAAFGALKFVPGWSPAEHLVQKAVEGMTFGMVTGHVAVASTAALEVFIGLMMLTGWLPRLTLVVTAGWLLGIMSPLVLFPGELFPGGLPTLAAQYILKDIILAAAVAVIGAVSLGARLVPAR